MQQLTRIFFVFVLVFFGLGFFGLASADLSVPGVFEYDAWFATPTGFLRVLDDTSNPQFMVFMGKDSVSEGINFTGMQEYVPATGTAIPTNALRELLVSSNGSTTWVHDGADWFLDAGNWSNRVLDPEDDGSDYLLFTAAWLAVNDSDNDDKHFIPWTREIGGTAKIRLVYITGWNAPVYFASWDGSAGDPYHISNCAELSSVSSALDSHFVLTQDVDCRSAGNAVVVSGDFSGNFDGSGKMLSIALTGDGENPLGLFRVLDGGTVRDLVLSGTIDADAGDSVGLLAGDFLSGTARDLIVTANISVTGNGWGTKAGWVIGEMRGGFFQNVILRNSEIEAMGEVGGIVGESKESAGGGVLDAVVVENSVVSGAADGVGGFVGKSAGEFLISGGVFVLGSVTNSSDFGECFCLAWWLVGVAEEWGEGEFLRVISSRVETDVDSFIGGGGLVGALEYGEIEKSFFEGSVRGQIMIGGLIGYGVQSSISDSYFSGGISLLTVDSHDRRLPPLAWWIAGYFEGNSVENSYALGSISVTGDAQEFSVWWVVWVFIAPNDLENVWSAVRISHADTTTWFLAGIFGVVDELGGDLVNSFFDEDLAGTDIAYRRDDEGVASFPGGNYSTTEMKTLSSYTSGGQRISNDTGFDIEISETAMNDGYPFLGRQIGDESSTWFINTLAEETENDEPENNEPENDEPEETEEPARRGGGSLRSRSRSNGTSLGQSNVFRKTDDGTEKITENSNDKTGDETEKQNDEKQNDEKQNEEKNENLENAEDRSETENSREESSMTENYSCPAEYQSAYDFARQYEITTTPSCEEAGMDEALVRKHAAKMMSNFAINILGQTPNTGRNCVFDDTADETEEFQNFTVLACQLGIMGLEFDGVTPAQSFNPDGVLDKAQFSTILSRVLFGKIYDGNPECRYCDHVDAMLEKEIITMTSDLFDDFRRAFAMIMLQRTDSDLQSGSDE